MNRTFLSLTLLLFAVPHLPAQTKTIAPTGKAGRPSTDLPQSVTKTLDIVYAQYGKRKMHLDLFAPNANAPRPAIIVVHGGGWLKGDRTRFHAMSIALAARGYITAAVEYRLGGEALFPAAIQDCNTAVRFLRSNAKKFNIDPKRIGAVGGSAGGHLVGLMAAAPHIKEFQGSAHAKFSSAIQSAIVLAGPLELATGPVAERSRKDPKNSNSNKFFGKTVDEAPELYKQASPYTHVSKSTPPILFMAGELDYPERNAATRAKLKKYGIATGIVVVKTGKHGCWNREPFFTPMVEEMDRFFKRIFSKPPPDVKF